MKVWVVDTFLDVFGKVSRNIPPTFVEIVHQTNLPKSKQSKHTDYLLVELDNGKLTPNIINPFANDEELYAVDSLNVYLTEKEAYVKYIELLQKIDRKLEQKILNVTYKQQLVKEDRTYAEEYLKQLERM